MPSRLGTVLILCLFMSASCLFSGAHAASPMVEKNLFSPERRPDAPEPAAPAPKGSSEAALRALQLDGVMVFGETRKAILRTKGRRGPQGPAQGQVESPYMAVLEGDRVGDFKVLKIESKSVQLEKDGQIHELSLFAEGKVVPPPPPMPVAPQLGVPGAAGENQLPQGVPPAARGNRQLSAPPGSPVMPPGAVATIPVPPAGEPPAMEMPGVEGVEEEEYLDSQEEVPPELMEDYQQMTEGGN